MSARRGWVFDNPPRTGNWPEPQPWWGVTVAGYTDPHFHSPCPVCGYATRFKQYGPMRCACPRAVAARREPEDSVTNAEQPPARVEPSGPRLPIADRYVAGRPRRGIR